MNTQKITNEFVDLNVVKGNWYFVTDDFYYRRKCKIIDWGNELVMAEYDVGLDKIVYDVTEDTPTLYVVFNEDYELGDEIPILVEEIYEIILIDDLGGTC